MARVEISVLLIGGPITEKDNALHRTKGVEGVEGVGHVLHLQELTDARWLPSRRILV